MISLEFLKNLSYDYHQYGVIKTVNTDNTYVVTINNVDFTLKARQGITPIIGNSVAVLIPNGNTNKKIIDYIE